MTFTDATTHQSSTGASLCLRHEEAKGDAKGVVHILHGLAEHSLRYALFARELSEAGYHVYAHDHRGHGFTQAPDAPVASFDTGGNGARLVMEDIAAIQSLIAGTHPGLPLFLFGHSMGGTFAMTCALEHPDRFAGAGVWNASLATGIAATGARAVVAWERFRLGSDVPSVALPKLTFGQWATSVKDRRTDFDWLSRDPAIVDAYIADPLCGWSGSVGMYGDILDLVSAATRVEDASRAAKELPYHLVGGGRDPATGFGKSVEAHVKRMKAAGFGDVTLRIFPEHRHETLNDIGREDAVATFTGWIAKVTPAS